MNINLFKTRHILTLVMLLAGAGALHAATLDAKVIDETGGPVADAVVVAVPLFDATLPANARRTEVLEQVNQQFAQFVTPVFVGNPVAFPNKDQVKHHVYSFSPAKSFQIPLYAGMPDKPVIFDKAGVVTLGCNIHDWMLSFLYISESPFFAKTDREGKAQVANLPAGKYELRVWHPAVTAPESASKKMVDLARDTMEAAHWAITVKPGITRVRRAPAASGGGYR
jgi:plastocyanin